MEFKDNPKAKKLQKTPKIKDKISEYKKILLTDGMLKKTLVKNKALSLKSFKVNQPYLQPDTSSKTLRYL
jgi:hypothetical protein